MSKLTGFYENLIEICGVKLGEFGRLVIPAEEDIYLKLDDKHIVFPEKQYLNHVENPAIDTVVFHPLSESSVRNVSEVQEILRRAAILRINQIGRVLLNKAIEINRNATADSSYKLNHKQSKLFATIGEIDEKFVKWWLKVDNRMTEDSKCRLFDVYLKMHGEFDNKRYDRVCTIASPLWDQVTFTTDSKIFGVTVERKKDVNTLKELLKTLFPRLETGGYIFGSSENVAPFLSVFIDSVVEIETRFNEILNIYGREASDTEGLYSNGLDIKRDADFSKLRNLIPADKAYNVGTSKDKEDISEKKLTSREKPVEQQRMNDVRVPRGMTDSLQMTSAPAQQPEPASTTSERPVEERPHRDSISSQNSQPFWNRDSRDDRYYGNRDDYRRDDRGYDRGYDNGYDRGRGYDNRRDDRRGSRYEDRRPNVERYPSDRGYSRQSEQRNDYFWNRDGHDDRYYRR